MMTTAKLLTIPGSALVVLVGPAGSGKSTFAREHFVSTEILSSDFFRGMVSDDEGDQEATGDAFALLHLVLEARLKRGKLCVVDATNILAKYRKHLIEYAHSFARPAIAIIFQTPTAVSVERAAKRGTRPVDSLIVRRHAKELASQTDEDLLREGFARVFRFDPADGAQIRRTRAASPRK
jgi:protein phosphatase